jgi:hypothetical protein
MPRNFEKRDADGSQVEGHAVAIGLPLAHVLEPVLELAQPRELELELWQLPDGFGAGAGRDRD